MIYIEIWISLVKVDLDIFQTTHTFPCKKSAIIMVNDGNLYDLDLPYTFLQLDLDLGLGYDNDTIRYELRDLCRRLIEGDAASNHLNCHNSVNN